jgi:hypothetical protein
MVDPTDEIGPEKCTTLFRQYRTPHCWRNSPRHASATHPTAGSQVDRREPKGKENAAFLSSCNEGRELEPRRALANPAAPASVAQLKMARACSMEIMMISSKCRIAPYGMLKLSVSWPLCVVLIKPRRWPLDLVDAGRVVYPTLHPLTLLN